MPVLTLKVRFIILLWYVLTNSFRLITAAKRGSRPLLAVSTEEGSVHIFNTSKREEWDPGESLHHGVTAGPNHLCALQNLR